MVSPELPPPLAPPRFGLGLFATEWRAFFVVTFIVFAALAWFGRETLIGIISFAALIMIFLLGLAHSILDSWLKARPPRESTGRGKARPRIGA